MEVLRPYQLEGITKIFSEWRSGKRSVLFQMPTGTGKTVLFAEIVKKGFVQKKKILIVVHRHELIEQIKRKLQEKEVDMSLIVAGEKSDYTKHIQVASIQTLNRREHPEANLIIIDECHHAKAATYKDLWEIYPNAKFLGVTATPIRLSGEGFDDLFDVLVTTLSVQNFIEAGFLVPISQYSCEAPDLSGVKQRQGDYMTSALSQLMLNNSLMADLIESYQQICNGKSTIVFAVDVEHSKEIVQRYRKAGIIAAHIDANTPKAERDQILTDFKKRKIQVVSNVEIITEGFDFPECEAVQLARPTKSLALYLQMVGRVMRKATNKKEGIVLDNAGLWLEHGLAIIDREWSLEGKGKKKKIGQEQTNEIALDSEGVLREVNRTRPVEVKGLKLIPVSVELRRLLIFESFLTFAKTKEHHLLAPYNRYLEYLKDSNKKITKKEFDYIQKRLNFFNDKLPPEKQFKKGYWYHQQREHGLT